MALVKNKNTAPELIVKGLLTDLNIHQITTNFELPCKPDFVFSNLKKAIFVHGCFWHGHQNCKRAKLPRTNTEFWYNKVNKNIQRDYNNLSELGNIGWDVLIIWQCELKNLHKTKIIIEQFLKTPSMSARNRIKAFFEKNVGKIVTTDQISEIANIRDYQRRIRELRNEYGMKIKTHVDRSDLKPGEYILESLELNPAIH